jgi:hypothetical protein
MSRGMPRIVMVRMIGGASIGRRGRKIEILAGAFPMSCPASTSTMPTTSRGMFLAVEAGHQAAERMPHENIGAGDAGAIEQAMELACQLSGRYEAKGHVRSSPGRRDHSCRRE